MKFYKLLCLGVFCFIGIVGNTQDLSQYYELLRTQNNDDIFSIRKEVDSIIGIYKRKGEILKSIEIAHKFSVDLYRKRLFEEAIIYGKLEISLYHGLQLKNNKYAKALYNIGLYYFHMSDYEESISYHKEVIAINKDPYSSAKSFCELGKYYYTKGDFFRSNDNYSYGVSVLENLDKKKLLIQKYLDYAVVLRAIRTEHSLDKLLTVLDRVNELFMLIPKHTWSLQNYKALNSRYANYYNTKERLDFYKANYYYSKVLDQELKTKDSTAIYATYTNLGALYTETTTKVQKDSTVFFLNNGLKYARGRKEKTIIYHQFSHYYLSVGKYQEALTYIHKSLINRTNQDININTLLTLDDFKLSDNQYYILLGLLQKATILIKIYHEDHDNSHIELALGHLLLADQLVDVLLGISTEEGSRLHWREKASEIYLKGILVCEMLNKKEKAFYFSEKKKALLLTEDIIKNTNKSELPDIIVTKENEFKKQIFDIENQILTIQNNEESKVLENNRFELKERYLKFTDSLQYLFPDYYKKKETTKILNLQEIQERLDTDDVIISYVSNKDRGDDFFSLLYAVFISKNQTEILKIGSLDTIEKLIIKYRNQLSKPFETSHDKLMFQQTASELFTLLIPKDKLSIPLIKKHLIIIPDGTLQYIPFESLIVDTNKNKYLIEENEISYAYSMSFLKHNTTVQRAYSKDLVAFSPVTFMHDNLEEITNSTNEINGIANNLSISSYKGTEASKQNFLSKTEDYKIIHLATHANFSDKLQIAFHDQNLEYYELYTSRNQAELVVLSACNTSLGKIANGEGVMSLARGFFYAGANTVVSSLWNANDKSTTQIMERFYSNLEAGQTKSKALHNAKINYLKSASLSDASPYYWATFILIGESDMKLFLDKNLYFWSVFILFIILFISGLLFFYKKR